MVRQINLGVNTPNPNITWQKFSRPILAVIAVIAVVLIVLFNQQISNLLELWGIKAAPAAGTASLQGADNSTSSYFLGSGYSTSEYDPITKTWVQNDDAVKVENNQLKIN